MPCAIPFVLMLGLASAVIGVHAQSTPLPQVYSLTVSAGMTTLNVARDGSRVSLEQIVAGLGDRLALLKRYLRYLPPRQQTLRSAIDWSYHLLTPAEQILLRRLGVFAGGCSLAAVQAVCSPNEELPFDLQEGISSLVNKSLLQRGTGAAGEPRFTMLESIRAYAWEKLEASGEAPEMRRRHAWYCVQLAARISLTISPCSAWRPSLDFWNSGVPSFATSNRPPVLGRSWTSASGNCSVSSAANLTARGS
jgi:hypothetical protein